MKHFIIMDSILRRFIVFILIKHKYVCVTLAVRMRWLCLEYLFLFPHLFLYLYLLKQLNCKYVVYTNGENKYFIFLEIHFFKTLEIINIF